MNYGKAIRVTRALADVPKRELARGLGTDPSYISLLEANKREPSREVLEKLADSLKVPLHLIVLMASEGSKSGKPEERRLAAIAEALAVILFAEDTDERRNQTRNRPTKPGKSSRSEE